MEYPFPPGEKDIVMEPLDFVMDVYEQQSIKRTIKKEKERDREESLKKISKIKARVNSSDNLKLNSYEKIDIGELKKEKTCLEGLQTSSTIKSKPVPRQNNFIQVKKAKAMGL